MRLSHFFVHELQAPNAPSVNDPSQLPVEVYVLVSHWFDHEFDSATQWELTKCIPLCWVFQRALCRISLPRPHMEWPIPNVSSPKVLIDLLSRRTVCRISLPRPFSSLSSPMWPQPRSRPSLYGFSGYDLAYLVWGVFGTLRWSGIFGYSSS